MRSVFVFCFIYLSFTLNAQEYMHLRFSTENGLLQNQVVRLYHDSKGYLWIGTKEGVSTFDGVNFKNFTIHTGLIGTEVRGIIEDEQGIIWVLTRQGLNKFDNFKLTTFSFKNEIPDFIEFNSNFYFDKNRKTLYLLAIRKDKRSFYSFDKKTLTHLLDIGKASAINFLPHLDLFAYDSTLIDLNTHKKSYINQAFITILQINSNTLFGFSAKGSFALDRNFKIKYSYNNNLLNYIRKKDDYDSIFSIEEYLEQLSLPSKSAYSVEIENNKLFIGHDVGLFSPGNKAFLHFLPEKNGFQDIWNVSQIDNEIILLSYIGQNTRINTKTLKSTPFKNKSNYYFGNGHITKSKEIVGTGAGYDIIEKNRIKHIVDNHIRAISYIYNDSICNQLIVCHYNGISIFKRNLEHTDYLNSQGYDLAYPLCIEKDKFGRIWVVGNTRINIFDYKKFTPVEGLLKKTGALSVKMDDRKNLWFGSKYGLIFYDYKNSKIIEHPFLKKTIVSLYQVDKKRLLIGTTNGMGMLDLNQFYDNDSILIQWFDKTNGFASSECQQNNFLKDNEGYIWVPLTERVIRIDTSKLQFNISKPNAIIESINEIDSNKIIYTKPDTLYRFIAGKQNFRIKYTAIEFNNPEKIQFSYRLKGKSNKWSSYSKNRYVDFTNLEPKKYTFELKARNECLIESDIVRLNFKINEYWYQYQTVKVVLIILLIISFLMLYRSYLKKKLLEKEEKLLFQKDFEKLKAQLLIKQLDNHFIFNAIAAAGNLAFKETPNEQYNYIGGLASLLRYLLRNRNDISVKFTEEIKHIFILVKIQQLRFSNRLKFNYKPNLPNSEIARLNVPILFLFHFVENAIKYSVESTSKVGIINFYIKYKNENYCQIDIEDNGIGLTEMQDKNKTSTGIGISSNSELIRLLNKNNKGNEITFTIKEKMNYGNGVIVSVLIPYNYNYNIENESINS